MIRVSDWVANTAGAMFGLGLVIAAVALLMVWAYRQGLDKRNEDAGRARVLAAMEDAAAKTVPLPQQRQGDHS